MTFHGEAELNDDDRALIDAYVSGTVARGLSDRTVGQHRQVPTMLARFVSPQRLLDVTGDQVSDWADELARRGLSAKSQRIYLRIMRGYFQWAIETSSTVSVNPVVLPNLQQERVEARRRRLPAESRQLIDDHVQHCRREGMRLTTIRDRRDTITRLAEFIAPATLKQITTQQVEEWVDDQIRRGLTRTSRRVYMKHAKLFLQWCARTKRIAVDPAAEMKPPRAPAGVPHPISDLELQRSLGAATGVLRAWLVLGAYCGLRASEIAYLRREDVLDAQEQPQVRVVNGKGGKDRLVPLPARVITELRPHLTGSRGRLWLAHLAVPQNTLSTVIGQHLRGIGIPHSAHSLRHFYATELYRRSGGDILMVKEMLGHASVATTQIYASFEQSVATRVAAELAETLDVDAADPPVPHPAEPASDIRALTALHNAIDASGLTLDQQAAIKALVAAFAIRPIEDAS